MVASRTIGRLIDWLVDWDNGKIKVIIKTKERYLGLRITLLGLGWFRLKQANLKIWLILTHHLQWIYGNSSPWFPKDSQPQ